MKREISKLFVMLLLGAMFLGGCGDSDNADVSDATTDSEEGSTNDNIDSEQNENESSVQTMGISEFENLLAELPLTILETEYVVQSEEYKALYPDMLQAILSNNTTEDIKNAVIAFVAWDSNNLPVKIESQIDFDGGSYVQKVNYEDINLVGGDTYGENGGLSLGEDCEISTCKAIAVSFETFNGDIWENPYFDEFCTLYEGQKYSDDMTVEVEIVDSSFSVSEKEADSSESQETDSAVSAEALENALNTLPITIIKTDYIVQDDQYKALYPDILQAVLQNNTTDDIKDVVVAFVAWDSNNLPVKIEGQYDFSGGSYVKKVNYADINLAVGDTYGEENGFALSENSQIENFKAIIVSYETFEGEIWENPYYEDFCSLYEGQKLN